MPKYCALVVKLDDQLIEKLTKNVKNDDINDIHTHLRQAIEDRIGRVTPDDKYLDKRDMGENVWNKQLSSLKYNDPFIDVGGHVRVELKLGDDYQLLEYMVPSLGLYLNPASENIYVNLDSMYISVEVAISDELKKKRQTQLIHQDLEAAVEETLTQPMSTRKTISTDLYQNMCRDISRGRHYASIGNDKCPAYAKVDVATRQVTEYIIPSHGRVIDTSDKDLTIRELTRAPQEMRGEASVEMLQTRPVGFFRRTPRTEAVTHAIPNANDMDYDTFDGYGL